ncbi:MAG: hypothetical protein AB7O24_04185 [Kofleriaceae bacterium]
MSHCFVGTPDDLRHCGPTLPETIEVVVAELIITENRRVLVSQPMTTPAFTTSLGGVSIATPMVSLEDAELLVSPSSPGFDSTIDLQWTTPAGDVLTSTVTVPDVAPN